ncbi:acyl carrier protein [Rhodoferax saidenbachensis]|uniref:Acyl carrier protein n=1 Tax=Rhodoferax saidenbachensis TaxID=1484693 RepID=A0A1P8KAS2_9BURK|nr:acyl carrier protein [Rhodoferax saidenbachensis]APW43107.1 acyl carrier protein [Rhodoferax saidenbachensis]
MTNEEILQRIKDIMSEVFDIDADRVVPEARLRDDLDIDSIDAVDLIVQLKPLVGRRMQPEAFKSVRTIGDVVDAIQLLVSGDAPANV